MNFYDYVLRILERLPEEPAMQLVHRPCGRYVWQGSDVNFSVLTAALVRHEERYHPSTSVPE